MKQMAFSVFFYCVCTLLGISLMVNVREVVVSMETEIAALELSGACSNKAHSHNF